MRGILPEFSTLVFMASNHIATKHNSQKVTDFLAVVFCSYKAGVSV